MLVHGSPETPGDPEPRRGWLHSLARAHCWVRSGPRVARGGRGRRRAGSPGRGLHRALGLSADLTPGASSRPPAWVALEPDVSTVLFWLWKALWVAADPCDVHTGRRGHRNGATGTGMTRSKTALDLEAGTPATRVP